MSQQFVVPQFIDSEPKLLGPITARQFLILFVTVLLCAFLKVLLSFWFFVAASVVFGGFGVVLAFVKINGQNFHYFLLNLAQTLSRSSIRVWQKDLSDEYLRQFIMREEPKDNGPKAPRKQFVETSRLNELSLMVNTGGAYRPDSDL